MKKQADARYLLIPDFVLTLAVYIFPPLTIAYNPSFIPPVSYSVRSIATALFMGAVYYLLARHTGSHPAIGQNGTSNIYKKQSAGKKILFCAGILLLLFAVQAAASFVSQFCGVPEVSARGPYGTAHLLFFMAGTCVFACFEELLYRAYLPSRTADLLGLLTKSDSERTQKALAFFSETFCVLSFAFAHRYAGWFAVLNALCAGIILRFTVKKTGAVWSACLIHSIYNCVLFLLLIKR